MSDTSFPEYAEKLWAILQQFVRAGEAIWIFWEADRRSSYRGFIKGGLRFLDGSELHFREFIDMTLPDPRIMYAYHYQDKDKKLVFRYDNALHRPSLPRREHKHIPEGIELTEPPLIEEILDEIMDYMRQK